MGSEKRALHFLILCFGIWICMSITEAKPATSEATNGDNVLNGLKDIDQLKDVRILHDDEEDVGNLLLTEENEEDPYDSSDLDEDDDQEMDAATLRETVDEGSDAARELENLSASESGGGGPRFLNSMKNYNRRNSNDSNEIRTSLVNLDRKRNCKRGKDGKCIKSSPDESHHSDSSSSSHDSSSYSKSKSSHHSSSYDSSHSDSDDSSHSDSDDSSHSDSYESYYGKRRRGFCGLNYEYTKGWSKFLHKLRKSIPDGLKPLAYPFLNFGFLDRACNLARETFFH